VRKRCELGLDVAGPSACPDSVRGARNACEYMSETGLPLLAARAFVPLCAATRAGTLILAYSALVSRRKLAFSSGSETLMNMPEPISKPAMRVRRGITLTYQW
jgi:hypothetical protein